MLKRLPKMFLYAGYLEKPRKSKYMLQLQLFIMTVLFIGNQMNRAEDQGDPSYYYNSCAPSTCDGFTLTDPLAVAQFCHPWHMEISCRRSNKLKKQKQTLLFTDIQTNKSFRLLHTNNFTATLVDREIPIVSFFLASDSFFRCGPVSEPNYTDPSSYTDFKLPPDYVAGTHFNCTVPIQGLQKAACLGCPAQDPTNFCYYGHGFLSYPNCETFHMYTKRSFNVSAEKDLRAYLKRGYEILYTKPLHCSGCQKTGGRCGINPSSSSSSWSSSPPSFVCFCPFTVHRLNCSDGMIVDIRTWASRGRSRPHKVLIIAVVSAATSMVFLALLVLILIFRSKHRMELKKEVNFNTSPSRYSYAEIKKFTNNLSTKLGEGGYGRVYKGTIHQNGVDVAVAVKLLKSKQSEKEFINEVATTGAVRHQHLVSLLGYCAQGKTRALVYEFMERGSLDKYIYSTRKVGGDDEEEEETSFERLSHKQTYEIALQIAKGILYLHQGCRHRILHFDIKPHNMLLDSNFTAKVADFGLARMMGEDHSHVSLTKARGTPGYVAPEMWLMTHGPVTEKSDVYSYGMMLLEMVGRRKNCNPEANESSQVYFPMWAYNKIKNGELPLLPMIRMGEDVAIEVEEECEREDGEVEILLKRMCLAGLWCIQYIPSNRPSMDRVIQILKGNVEVGIPLHPFPQLTAENMEYYSNNSSAPFTAGSVSWSLEPR
ncbi:LEAF RUST 10 DISEASE-RESISTANCE LOCUS RECEPTOR-LIKE PROTEIN KINASE-like 2.1 [Macadamia integrifolia]|uniref:LEAF RUST 10 DISEASE-RESISTANCE LOCUS RECEPTOR-LIKE PROTEIN KINASE-like 2.1 n=1 Tax=Macadamia integrifolia TaxID=60698 RepID=UPI001C4F2A32|nr:LEAF RUST 10 DISEASE-RESISTANCE LOCUS RECEPTOR-LIKE PROTEIN KINASE-like 2.1 [Macadamia integrifolia]